MAAVAEVQTVNITVNDIPVAVPKGELIVESVKRIGLEIPIFCYHPRMKPVGMCRMCLVEVGTKQADGSVRMMPKPQAACTLPASEGLVIVTDSASVHKDRRGVLEFLLINHPLDCPVCDRGGECPLQNNTLFYGPSTSRYVEIKRHAHKAFPLSKYVTLDLERCIQCGRCVRFTEEISGDSQLAFRFRGASMQPSTFELLDFDSKFSGNVIEICPVGALTNRTYRFRARPWDLETVPGICTECSNGCNVFIDRRGGKMVRINGRTNEAINEEWTCDRGKFGHAWLNGDRRLGQPLVRDGGKLAPVEWPAAYAQILKAFGEGVPSAALAGTRVSNEGLHQFKRLFRDEFKSPNLDHRFTRLLPKGDVPGSALAIADLEDKPTILVFGTSLADESPIVFLRVRKAWFKHGAKVIVAHDQPTEVDAFADSVLRYRPGTGSIVLGGLLAKIGADRDLADLTPERVEAETGVPASVLTAVADQIVSGATILATTGIYDADDAPSTVERLTSLGAIPGGSFHLMARGANERGAQMLGISPAEGGLDTHGILKGCADGTVKSLWLVGVDPFQAHPDRELVARALENVDFLVVQDVAETEATPFASVVLPMTGPAEEAGTWVNVEGRVQRMQRSLKPIGEAKPAWQIFSEVALRVRPARPLFSQEEVLASIVAEKPAFAEVG